MWLTTANNFCIQDQYTTQQVQSLLQPLLLFVEVTNVHFS